jgi:NDP-sugar pyrophosphorylase family protein
VKAVVLVGGEGTRLRPLTLTTPKPLLPIANQPHIERQLAWLASHGVDQVVLSMGYLPDAFHAHFRHDHSGHDVFGDITLEYAVEDEPLGTAGAIRFAADGVRERFIVCNGDVLTGLDLGAMVRFHDERGAEATISLAQVDDPSAFGVVPTNPDGGVIAFVEKPPPGKAPSNWINAGTYILEPSFLDRIPPRLNVSVERETFPRVLADPGLLYGYQSNDYWLDIGTPEKYLEAHNDVLAGKVGLPPAVGASEMRPGVWVQGEVEIGASAQIDAPALLGRGVHIEDGAHVAASVLGESAYVERNAEVIDAVLHKGAHVSKASSVRHSVLGPGAVLDSEAAVSDATIVGAGASVASGTMISGGRVW